MVCFVGLRLLTSMKVPILPGYLALFRKTVSSVGIFPKPFVAVCVGLGVFVSAQTLIGSIKLDPNGQRVSVVQSEPESNQGVVSAMSAMSQESHELEQLRHGEDARAVGLSEDDLQTLSDVERLMLALKLLGHGDGTGVDNVAQENVLKILDYREIILAAQKARSHARAAASSLTNHEAPVLSGKDLKLAMKMLEHELFAIRKMRDQVAEAIGSGRNSSAQLRNSMRRLDQLLEVKLAEQAGLEDIAEIATRYRKVENRAEFLTAQADQRWTSADAMLDALTQEPLNEQQLLRVHEALGVSTSADDIEWHE